MDLENLRQKMMAAARLGAGRDQVPYAFEKRIMAQLPARAPAPRELHWWTCALWRAAAPCLGIALCVVGWALVRSEVTTASGDFSDQIENVLLAAGDSEITSTETSW